VRHVLYGSAQKKYDVQRQQHIALDKFFPGKTHANTIAVMRLLNIPASELLFKKIIYANTLFEYIY